MPRINLDDDIARIALTKLLLETAAEMISSCENPLAALHVLTAHTSTAGSYVNAWVAEAVRIETEFASWEDPDLDPTP